MRFIAGCYLFYFIFCCATTVYAGKPFDDFSGELLDSAKWRGKDGEALTMGREIINGVFESWAVGIIDDQVNPGILNRMPLENPNTINTVSVDAKILMASISDTVNAAGAGIEGSFYNEAGGAVWANIKIALTLNGYDVVCGITTPDNVFHSSDPFVLPITKDETYNLKIVYDGNIGFTFTVVNNTTAASETHTVSGINAKSGAPAPEDAFKSLSTEIWGQTTGMGIIVAEFDNVMVNNALFDDFSTGAPDKTRWIGYEVGRYSEDKEVELVLGNTGNSSETQLDLFIKDDHISTNLLQADFSIESVSNYGTDSYGLMRLISDVSYNTTQTGPPYNGEDGEIYAYVTVNQYANGSFAPDAYLFSCAGANCSSIESIFYQQFTSCNIQTDTRFTVSIERKEKNIIFRCEDELITHTLTGTVYPSTADKWREIRLMVESPSGNPGVMKAHVDNVYIGNAFPWNIFLPSILTGDKK